MTKTLLRAGALTCALMTSTCLTAPATAQAADPSVYQQPDENGVDLTDGSFNFSLVEGAIGSGETGIALVRQYGVGGMTDNITATLRRTETGSTANIVLIFGNRREEFSGGASAYTFTSAQGSGATLTKSLENLYTYHAADGTVTTYEAPPGLSDAPNNAYCSDNNRSLCVLVATQTVRPNGASVTYGWEAGENCQGNGQCAQFWRLRGISNSFGYQLGFTFTTESNPTSGLPGTSWHQRASATLSNVAVSGAPTRSIGYAYPSSGVTEVTTDAGLTWRLTAGNAGLFSARRPGSSSDDISVTYATGTAVVSQVTIDGVTTDYSRSVSGSTATMVRTDALSNTLTVVSDLNVGRPTSVTDPLSRTTSFTYDSSGRLTQVSAPLGNTINTTYDSRGNVTEVRRVAASGSGLADIVTGASYVSSCSNLVTCNQPTNTTDAQGNVTSYTYDSTHGGVTSVTAPAVNGTSPQTRIAYTQTNGEYLPTAISACASGTAGGSPSCVGTASESRTVIGYDANGNATSIERRDGTGALSATTAMTYTSAGDVETVDGPLSGSADTARYRYDGARRRVGAISADPDGSGGQPHRAQRMVYDSATGLPTAVQSGTVTSQSDSAWAAFSAAEAVETSYDSHNRPIVQRLVSGSTTYALTQTSYDALGRPECVAQRMNAAEFAPSSLPTSACTLDTTGAHGPDRITRTTRDAAGQVTLVQTGYGVTGVEADEVASTYTGNGRVDTVTDAENNRTTYVYDGHDRLSRTRYPSTTQGAGTSSTTDYEELTYETHASGTRTSDQVASRRLRDGGGIGYSYDELGRLVFKDLTGELGTAYTYDLIGRMTSAYTIAQTLTFSYDALGRNIDQTGPNGTMTSGWDLAGQRTSLAWPGGFTVNYDHLVTGEVSAIRENGSTNTTCTSSNSCVLATYAYDSLGRRTGITRGNGTTTAYSYDAVSRLSQLAQNLNGTTYDLTLDFTHNPAGQIASADRSNYQFSFYGLANSNVANSHNGLNQTTASGSNTISHDSRGNVTGIGAASYGYSSENLMTSAGSSTTLGYDPLMRLQQVATSSATTRFGYDGANMAAEYDTSGNATRRFVHGPGVDEPIVWYEVGDSTERRFLHADERGSIIAVTNNSGTIIGGGNYDENGTPQSGAILGRFGFTGQAWLPEIGMYYYRARIYNPNPNVPVFMQGDPAGFGGGMNGYAYPSDPINLTDPSGMKSIDDLVGTGSRIRSNSSTTGVAPGHSGYSTRGGWTTTPDQKIFAPGVAPTDAVSDSVGGQSLLSSDSGGIVITGARLASTYSGFEISGDFQLAGGQEFRMWQPDRRLRLQGRARVGPLAGWDGIVLRDGLQTIFTLTHSGPPMAFQGLPGAVAGLFGSVTLVFAPSDHIPFTALGRTDIATNRFSEGSWAVLGVPHGSRYLFVIGTQTTPPNTTVTVYGY